MSPELELYRAVAYVDRCLEIGYAPAYAVHQAADVYHVPAGQLAELLLAKRVECDRARTERNAMQQHDEDVEHGTATAPAPARDARRAMSAEARERINDGLRRHHAERRARKAADEEIAAGAPKTIAPNAHRAVGRRRAA